MLKSYHVSQICLNRLLQTKSLLGGIVITCSRFSVESKDLEKKTVTVVG